MKNISTMNYDPKKCPCFQCTKRTPYCHGHCAEETAFNESKPQTLIVLVGKCEIHSTRKVG